MSRDGAGPRRFDPRVAWPPTIALDIQAVTVADEVARRDETRGLLTALYERRLGAIHGVIPVVDGVEPRPGLRHAVEPAERWTLSIQAGGRGDELALELTLCDPTGDCEVERKAADRTHPAPAITDTVRRVASNMDRRVLGQPATWTVRETADDYALLMVGRAAAIVYGQRPPVPPEDAGNNRKDPLARAVYLDPAMATAWFLRSRTALGGTEGQRLAAAQRASSQDPDDPLLVADAAALALADGQADEALRGFEAMRRLAPDDLRFAVGLAEAALLANEPEVARRAAARLRYVSAADAERLSVEVRLAEAQGQVEPITHDALLLEWQVADPTDPAPVQRRIDQRVALGDFASALDLVPELYARAPTPQTQSIELSLAAATNSWAQAATVAAELGERELGLRLQALELRAEPARAARLLEGLDAPDARLARAVLLLEAGEPALALASVEPVLVSNPYRAVALDLHQQALERLGRIAEAQESRARLVAVDPLHEGAQARLVDPLRALLAPTPTDLSLVLARSRELLEETRATGQATARIQNRWQATRPAGRTDCGTDALRQLAARAERLGIDWRQRLQSARTARDDAARMRDAPTVRPLLIDAERRRLADLDAAVEADTNRYRMAHTLQAQQILAWRSKCPADLSVGPGLEASGPLAHDEQLAAVAILGAGGGLLCPTGLPADGRVAVSSAVGSCWAPEACTCEPERVLPGAVLGPADDPS